MPKVGLCAVQANNCVRSPCTIGTSRSSHSSISLYNRDITMESFFDLLVQSGHHDRVILIHRDARAARSEIARAIILVVPSFCGSLKASARRKSMLMNGCFLPPTSTTCTCSWPCWWGSACKSRRGEVYLCDEIP